MAAIMKKKHVSQTQIVIYSAEKAELLKTLGWCDTSTSLEKKHD